MALCKQCLQNLQICRYMSGTVGFSMKKPGSLVKLKNANIFLRKTACL